MRLEAEAALGRGLVAWVDFVSRRARAVLALSAVVTLAVLVYTALHLGVNSDVRQMVSADVGFRQAYDRFAADFPILDNAILVVVDADSSLAARRAASELAERLRREEALFESVFALGSGPFFERNALLYLETHELEDLADRLATLQPLLAELARDGSLQSFVELIRDGIRESPEGPATGLDWTPVFDRMSAATRAVLAEHEETISWETLLLSEGVPGATPRQVLVLEPRLEFRSLLPARDAVLAIRGAAEELELAGDGIDVRVTGNPVLNYEEMLGIAREVSTAGIASFLVVAVVLWIGLRSRRLVSGTLVALLIGLVLTAGFATAAVGTLNLLSITFAVLFIGLGVDFGIHFSMRYAELRRAGRNHRDGLRETARSVGSSLVLCAVTTAIGFLVFLPTDYIAVAELGLISGAGMFVSLFCTLTILPAWLALVGENSPLPIRKLAAQGFARLAGWPFRHARAIRFTAAGAALAALASIPALEFDPNVVRLRDPSTESVQTYQSLLAEAETSPWNIEVVADDEAEAAELAARLEPLPVVDTTRQVDDYLPADQEEKREVLDDVALFMGPRPPEGGPQALPDVAEVLASLEALRATLQTPGLVNGNARQNESVSRLDADLAELIRRLESEGDPLADIVNLDESLLASLRDHVDWIYTAIEPGPATRADLPADLATRLVSADGRMRVQVFPSEDLTDPDALRRFVDQVQLEVPEATGSAVSLVGYSRTIIGSLEQALTTAVVVIAALLLLLWRRVPDTLLVMAPLLLAAGLTAALSVLIAVPFNFANVIVIPLLLGIGVDSGIHLVHRYRIEGDANLLRTGTARAVLFSAVTTVASFGSLAFSGHRGMASLGLLLTLGVAAMLACNLLVLPALLSRRHKQGPAPPPPGEPPLQVARSLS